MSAFCNIYEPMEALFIARGFAPFEAEYTAHWLHTNQIVTVQGSSMGCHDIEANSNLRARIQGIWYHYDTHVPVYIVSRNDNNTTPCIT
jgi:hypothetical protein